METAIAMLNEVLQSSNSDRILFGHEILLQNEVVRISVDLNAPDTTETWNKLPHLVLLKSPIKMLGIEQAVTKFVAHAFVVGGCQHADSIQIAGYIRSQELFTESFDDLDDEIELFVTEFDKGRFYRSFLLPLDFRNLVSSMASTFEIASSVGAKREIKAIHQLKLNKNSRIQEFIRSIEASEFISNVSDSTLTLAARKILDLCSETRDLAWIYKTASESEISYISVDYDLR